MFQGDINTRFLLRGYSRENRDYSSELAYRYNKIKHKFDYYVDVLFVEPCSYSESYKPDGRKYKLVLYGQNVKSEYFLEFIEVEKFENVQYVPKDEDAKFEVNHKQKFVCKYFQWQFHDDDTVSTRVFFSEYKENL